MPTRARLDEFIAMVVSGDHDGAIERCKTGKVSPPRLNDGDSYNTYVGGGGGFWSPLERDPEQGLCDVRSGYVSLEAAERDYGVIVHRHDRKFELDLEATRRLRAATTPWRTSADNPAQDQQGQAPFDPRLRTGGNLQPNGT